MHIATGLRDDIAGTDLKQDPTLCGISGARRESETIARCDEESGLTKRLVGIDKLFPTNTLGT